jgi:hypothetical protein
VIAVLSRAAAVLAGLWAGVLLCIGAMAAPAAFAVLVSVDAGRFVGRLLGQEAYLSLALAVLLFLIERSRTRRASQAGQGSVFSVNLMLLLGTLFCTVAGYFAVQPMMAAARAGQGPWSFGALHAVSGGLFLLKGVLVLALAWRMAPAFRKTATTS